MEAPLVEHSVAAGDGLAYAARQKAQEELLETAESVLAWMDDRAEHAPDEWLEDDRELRHRRRLKRAVRKLRQA